MNVTHFLRIKAFKIVLSHEAVRVKAANHVDVIFEIYNRRK